MFLVFVVNFLLIIENFFSVSHNYKRKMLPLMRKKVRLSIDEKLWILNHRKENLKINARI